MQVITVKAEIEIPSVPNFLRMTDGGKLPLSAVSDEGLQEIAAEWGVALVKRAQKIREEQKKTELAASPK